jgi:hypothetical protein
MKRPGATRSSKPPVWEVSRLGPIEPSEEAEAEFRFMYLATRANTEPLMAWADTDESGLSDLLEQAQGAPLRCEPALESAARPLGIACSSLSAAAYLDAAHLAASVAALASGGAVPVNRDMIPALLLAASRFVRREPWRHWPRLPGGVPTISIKVRSPLRREFPELCVFMQRGMGKEKPGYHCYFLFEGEGSTERLLEACARGPDERDAVIGELPSLLVQLSEGPTWAVAAIARAYGCPVLPKVAWGSANGMLPCDEIETAVLTCALEALSLFRGKRQVAYTKTPDGMVSVELTSPLG